MWKVWSTFCCWAHPLLGGLKRLEFKWDFSAAGAWKERWNPPRDCCGFSHSFAKQTFYKMSIYVHADWLRKMKEYIIGSVSLFSRVLHHLVTTTDYRCEDGRIRLSTSCVTISNLDSLSSSETGVNPGTRSWKKHLSEWARCQKAIGDIYFTKKWRA